MLGRRGLLLRLAFLPVLVGAGIAVAILGHGGNGDAATPAAAPAPATTQATSSGAFSKSVGGGATPSSTLASRACPKLTNSKALPANFPKTLPLPAGTVITVTREYRPRGFPPTFIAYGYAPLSLRNATLFFIREMPRHGFTLGPGDAEVAEAEAPFQGHGVKGAWKVAAGSIACPNLVGLLVGISPLQ